MAKKYYAVAKGKTPGIYLTWNDCKAQVDGFSGAVYKGFATIQEAEEFVKAYADSKESPWTKKRSLPTKDNAANKEIKDNTCEEPISTDTHLVAYVDGSYEHSMRQYAYGCVLVLAEDTVTLNGSGNEEDYVAMRNVAGEILGSEHAIQWAVEHGYSSITIYYDYEGIEKWANGIWKANKIGTQRYKEFVAKQREKIDISFSKVAAHTGVKYNEMADQLAKAALGL